MFVQLEIVSISPGSLLRMDIDSTMEAWKNETYSDNELD